MHHTRGGEPVLITSAHESSEQEYLRRRKKYAITMSIRTLCVLAAALTYQISILLALAFIVGGMVLPWCAVIVANDRPARKKARTPSYGTASGMEKALTSGDDGRTVDG